MRGKSWSIEEERQLRELVGSGLGVDEISKIMGKTRLSIRGKMNNLRLTVVVAAAGGGTGATTITTTSSQGSDLAAGDSEFSGQVDSFAAQLKKDDPLPSIRATLQVLHAALVALQKPNLSRNEITRLSKIIDGVKVYQNLYAGFVKYDAIEKEVLELKKQLGLQTKTSS